MMIINSTFILKTVPGIKITCLMLAYNSTFVFLSQPLKAMSNFEKGSNLQTMLNHIDSKSTILSIFMIEQPVHQFKMIRQDFVLVALVKSKSIQVIDLRNTSIRQFPFEFLVAKIQDCRLLYFTDSQMICLSQTYCKSNQLHSSNNSTTILTYFKPLAVEIQMFQCYYNNNKQAILSQIYQQKAFQANNSSLVVFIANAKQEGFTWFKLHDLEQTQDGYKSRVRYVKMLGPHSVYLPEYVFWQTRQDELLVVIKSIDKKQSKVIDIQTGQQRQYSYKFNKIDKVVLMRSYIFVREERLYHKSLYKQIQYYIGYRGQNKCYISYLPYVKDKVLRICDYDSSILVEDINRQQKQTIFVNIRKQVELKDIYMSFMLYVNEDFDDDLLLDTIQLLY